MVHNNSILYIDTTNILQNYRNLCNKVAKNVEVGAVVKANAYGLGMKEIASVLASNNCKSFFVSSVHEGIALRSALKTMLPHATIYILTGITEQNISICCEHNLIPVLNSFEQCYLMYEYHNTKNITINYALKFDTGMGRLGFPFTEAEQVAAWCNKHAKKLHLKCVFSHLACAEDASHPLNAQQLERFETIKQYFTTDILFSLCNSAGIFLGEKYHFDLVRPGAYLYGICDTQNAIETQQSVVTLHAEIIQKKILPYDSTISYGASYQATKGQKIFVARAGYADGYFRYLGNHSYVAYNDKTLPIVGVITMDMMIINASTLSETEFADAKSLEIIGHNVTISHIAKTINSIGYEVITSLGQRYNRIYK